MVDLVLRKESVRIDLAQQAPPGVVRAEHQITEVAGHEPKKHRVMGPRRRLRPLALQDLLDGLVSTENDDLTRSKLQPERGYPQFRLNLDKTQVGRIAERQQVSQER